MRGARTQPSQSPAGPPLRRPTAGSSYPRRTPESFPCLRPHAAEISPVFPSTIGYVFTSDEHSEG